MLKKTINYTDYNGTQRSETHYFNLNKAEVMDWEMSMSGGLSEWIKTVVATQDAPTLMKLFKDLITKSYGVKSADGKRFVKSEELTNEFIQTEAYTELYIELLTKEGAMSDFVKGILPSNMDAKAIAPANN